MKATELVFKGWHSTDSIKSMYGHSLETFMWMRAFESFTGNGGGDADCDDPEAILKKKLVAARKLGLVPSSPLLSRSGRRMVGGLYSMISVYIHLELKKELCLTSSKSWN
jgi:hypothetical protein